MLVVLENFHVLWAELRAGGFKGGGRDARGEHYKDSEWQSLTRFQNISDSVQPQHVGYFMWVGHYCGGPQRYNVAGKFRYAQHAGFEVQMSVYEAGRNITPFEIDCFGSFIFAEAHHNAFVDSN